MATRASSYITGATSLMSVKALGLLVTFFVGAIVARYLGPEQMGIWGYALSITAILSNLAVLGLPSLTPHELVKGDIPKYRILGADIAMRTTGSFLAMGLSVSYVALMGKSWVVCVLVACVSLSYVIGASRAFDAYFEANAAATKCAIAGLVSLLIGSGIHLLLVGLQAPLAAFGLSALAGTGSMAIVLTWLFYRDGNRITLLEVDWPTIRHLLKRCWPLIFSGIVVMIYMRIDQVMVMEILGPSEAGQYTIAARISEAYNFIPVSLAAVLFPAIINAKKVGEKHYAMRRLRFYSLMLWSSSLLSITVYLLSPWIIPLLFGNDYTPAVRIVQIYCWSGIFAAIGVATSRYLIIEGLETISLVFTLIGAMLNILLNLILIPQYGTLGAAAATLVSYSLAGWLSLALLAKTRPEFLLTIKAINPHYVLNRRPIN